MKIKSDGSRLFVHQAVTVGFVWTPDQKVDRKVKEQNGGQRGQSDSAEGCRSVLITI